MTTPGYGGAARTNESGSTGTGSRGPANSDAGIPSSIFGIQLPQGSGAPGSAGASGGSDPTNQPGQLSEGFAGIGPAEVANSGAPGSQGAGPGGGGGTSVSYTDPGSFMTSYKTSTVSGDVSGSSDWTQAQAGQYTGANGMPGITDQAGENNPGGGTVHRFGRS